MRHGYVPEPPQSNGGVDFPYENYHVSGPNPAPGLESTYAPSDFRLHAPIAAPIPAYVQQDAANTQVQRIPQVRPYPVEPIPGQTEYHFAPGYQAPVALMNRGWTQTYVPELVPSAPLIIHAPVLELSQPITWDMRAAVDQPIHPPLKGKAPKAH